jgi:hypothetical protein
MKRIVEFKTVNAISAKELDYAVNRQIAVGFQPLGSPYVVGSGSSQTIYQSMVKFESTPGQELNKADDKPAA